MSDLGDGEGRSGAGSTRGRMPAVIHQADAPHVVERRHRQLCARCGVELNGYDLDHPPEVLGEASFHPLWWAVGTFVGHDGGAWWITREEPTCEPLSAKT